MTSLEGSMSAPRADVCSLSSLTSSPLPRRRRKPIDDLPALSVLERSMSRATDEHQRRAKRQKAETRLQGRDAREATGLSGPGAMRSLLGNFSSDVLLRQP